MAKLWLVPLLAVVVCVKTLTKIPNVFMRQSRKTVSDIDLKAKHKK